MLAQNFARITANGTTELVADGNRGKIFRVVVGVAGTAGRLEIQDQAGAVIQAIALTALGSYRLDYDGKSKGLQAVASAITGTPDVTVYFEGGG